MSNVADIVHQLTEGDDDFDFEGDQKDLQPSEWAIKLLHDTENGLWLAQLFWGGSPYGVVASHVDKETCMREGERMLQRFQQEERAYLQIGKRVRSYETGEEGTITGIPAPNDRWVHWDSDGGDPNSASRHPAYELELLESLEDEDDLKDAFMPNGFEARIKHSTRDDTWSVLFYYDGKFQGSSSGAETEEIAKARAINWVKEFNRVQFRRPFDQVKYPDVWCWYYGFNTGSAALEFDKVQEGLEDEDDFKLEVHNAFAKGQRVRVLTGTYAGEPGIVEGPFNYGNGEIGFWVHLENSDDPDSAITYPTASLEIIQEAMEDDDMRVPPFKYKIFGSSSNQVVFGVYGGDEEHERWLGSVMADLNHGQYSNWKIIFIDRLHKHVNIPVPSQEEGAFRLWLDSTGDNPITEAMDDDDEVIAPKFRIEPIDPGNNNAFDIYNHDQWIGRITRGRNGFREEDTIWIPMWAPDKYDHKQPESFKTAHQAAEWFYHHWYFAPDQNTVEAIVNEATEDEDESDWIKSMIHDPILMSKSALEAAGFEVNTCERQGDSIVLKFTWPTPTVRAKIDGFKRATEVVEPIIGKIKTGDFRVESLLRGVYGEEKIAEALIRKRLEDDPTLWRVEKKSQRQLDHQAFWTIIFNGQDVGEFYATPEGAERLRRELVELHRVMPFNTVGWDVPGDPWGNGKAIAWWRAHRNALPNELRVGQHHLDKSLTKSD